jgi:hypothetical protein
MTDKLWCIRIPGPDDIYAAPNHAMAEHMAACHNEAMAEYFKAHPEKLEHWGVTLDEIKAQVIEWEHGAKEHAESLAEFKAEEWRLASTPRKDTQ